ncbi:alpha/beta fold hydrolase [Pseudonocardia yuanmonensis]|uniref:Alpha/beta fold hydrolase n=1 Tax=Pseudonocardia yuanmonensis TaxID=1095914 RepID=A0ABP8W6M8_9PSEU
MPAPRGGAASSFRGWADAVPPGVELVTVQYPGREDRIREEPWTDAVAMAGTLAGLLAADPRPLVLFGHNLGGTLAYEAARRLPRPPARLVVWARIAPTVPPARVFRGGTDEELAAELRRLGGTDARVLDHPELRALVLPAFRADLQAAGGYVHPSGPPLRCPVRLLLGAEDPAVDPAEALRWAEVAPAGFTHRVFPGGHFYLHEQRDEVLAEILRP